MRAISVGECIMFGDKRTRDAWDSSSSPCSLGSGGALKETRRNTQKKDFEGGTACQFLQKLCSGVSKHVKTQESGNSAQVFCRVLVTIVHEQISLG